MKSGNNYRNLISHCIIVKYFLLTRLLLLYINRIELKKYLLRKLSQHAVEIFFLFVSTFSGIRLI